MSRILAVDDSPSIRQLVSVALSEHGHQVQAACDGVEALKLTASNTFDLIITDINMPNMNGLEFIRALRSSGNRFTPVLVLTTEVNPLVKEQAKAAGATGWIVKPFAVDGLRQVIKKAVL